jgi:hypothetical protein
MHLASQGLSTLSAEESSPPRKMLITFEPRFANAGIEASLPYDITETAVEVFGCRPTIPSSASTTSMKKPKWVGETTTN